MPAGPTPPRAPGYTSCWVGSGAHSADAAAIRASGGTAVPDGASIFVSWCSSMISAVSKNGAASSAKRIISTALMAKLAAMMQLLPLNSLRNAVEVVVVEPGGAHDCVHAVHRQPRQRDPGGRGHGEVDHDVAVRIGQRAQLAGDRDAMRSRYRRACGSTAATSSSAGSAATASHTVAPMRPPAPTTPTRIELMAVTVVPCPDAGRDG